MSATYNYKTGKITVDFHFRRKNEICKLAQLPCRVGSVWCIKHCPHNAGSLFLLPQIETYIFCKHPNAYDSEGADRARAQFYEDFEIRALSAL